MENWRNNINFILVNPKEPGNIGSAARAIKNMGFGNLSLVNAPELSGEARWFAHNAEDVLENASRHVSLNSVIDEATTVVGTTRRKGKKRGQYLDAEAGAIKLYSIAKRNKVAILFGSESKGLTNQHTEKCGFLISIPTSRSQPSLNLAHSVLILAYELHKRSFATKCSSEILCFSTSKSPGSIVVSEEKSHPNSSFPKLVSHREISDLIEHISNTLSLLGYVTKGDRDLHARIIQNIRNFIGRAGMAEWELRMLHGICAQAEKALRPEKL